MPAVIPPGYVSVDAAKHSQGHHNVIGVVVDCLPKNKTGGTSFAVTFTIKDSDYGKGNQTWKGLKIKYFNNDEHKLPDVKVNDVFLLRRLRVRLYQGALIGVVSNTDNVSWALLRQSEGPGSLGIPVYSPGSSELTLEEKTYTNTLVDSVANPSSTPMSSLAAESSVANIASQRKDRFSLIKNLSVDTFVDLTVHVIKTWYQDSRVHLYVTDYTTNKSLFNYQDNSDDENESALGNKFGFSTRNSLEKRTWQGPKGKMTLQVTLWDPHSAYARENVYEDTYVALRNVRVKLDKMNGMMEGALHTDQMWPKKENIMVLDNDNEDSRFVELKQRKRDYWRQNKMNKRKLAKDFGEDEGSKKKNAKRKLKEQQRLKKQQELQQKQPPRKEEGQTEIHTMYGANRPNPHVQAKDQARMCRNVSEILTNESHNISLPDGIQYRLPFQNVKYRTTVRVVDFFPPDIDDFAVPCISRSLSTSSSQSSDGEDEDISSKTRIKWAWRFCLLVEDVKIVPGQPRDRMKLFVSGAEAEFLLKLDAVDLRRDQHTSMRLKEKLCVLWGDLEERKSSGGGTDTLQKAPSQRPFTCCVKEYGVRCACWLKANHRGIDEDIVVRLGPEHNQECLGWERRFALFGTTIHED